MTKINTRTRVTPRKVKPFFNSDEFASSSKTAASSGGSNHNTTSTATTVQTESRESSNITSFEPEQNENSGDNGDDWNNTRCLASENGRKRNADGDEDEWDGTCRAAGYQEEHEKEYVEEEDNWEDNVEDPCDEAEMREEMLFAGKMGKG